MPSVRVCFATGEGERGCSWGEWPYVPEELNVFCDSCRFDFVTMEGTRPARIQRRVSTVRRRGRTLRTYANGRGFGASRRRPGRQDVGTKWVNSASDLLWVLALLPVGARKSGLPA